MIKLAAAAILAVSACQPAMAQDLTCFDMHEHKKNIVRNQAIPVFAGSANDAGMDFVVYVTPQGKFFAFTESQLTQLACMMMGGDNPISLALGDPA